MDIDHKLNTLFTYFDASKDNEKCFSNFSLDEDFYNSLKKSLSDIEIIDAYRISRLNSSFNINWSDKAINLINSVWDAFTSAEGSNKYSESHKSNSSESGKNNFFGRFWRKS